MAKRYSVIIKKKASKAEVFWYATKSKRNNAYANFVRTRSDSEIIKGQAAKLKLEVTYTDDAVNVIEYVTEEARQEGLESVIRHTVVKNAKKLN